MKPGDYVDWCGIPSLVIKHLGKDRRRGYDRGPAEHQPPPEDIFEIEFILLGHRTRQRVYGSSLRPLRGLVGGLQNSN